MGLLPTPLLATKLYIPPPKSKAVFRSRLIKRLNESFYRKLTLISAPAGFGKTTLISEWISSGQWPVAWLSLDKEDNDPYRFLAYLSTALQTIEKDFGEGVLRMLKSPQLLPIESILTILINEITNIPDDFTLVLDDYHVLNAPQINHALTFLLKHLPEKMHLIIATRRVPNLPLARLRVGDQLTELGVTDLRFTFSETTGFLNQVMGLNLSSEEISELETRTEGWVAGLQLAALSMQGNRDTTNLIKSFTGTHRFILDYLIKEVLDQQPKEIQTFLLRTSILDRLCGPLCDAVLLDPSISGQKTLEYLEKANIFIVPLDEERHWYRYHHLFLDLLRERLHQNSVKVLGEKRDDLVELHKLASRWYEQNDLEVEAFHHAVAANDIEHATRLVEGDGMPLQFRGAATPVIHWLESLSKVVLNAHPSLWVMYASAQLFLGQTSGVEEKVQAAETILAGIKPDEKTLDLLGHIAAIRATLAVSQNQVETIIAQSHRALKYLHPDNLTVRTSITWTLGHAYELQGDRPAAMKAYIESIANSQAIGHIIITIVATIGLGNLQEAENQLYLAGETYQQVLNMVDDQPVPVVCEAHLGLARIFYQWNDLDAAEKYGEQSIQLAKRLEKIDRFVACQVFLARLKLAQGDVHDAAVMLAKAAQLVHQHNFVLQISEVAATQVLVLLHQNNLTAAAQLAKTHNLPLSLARVHLAQKDPSIALELLESVYREMEAKDWPDEKLKVLILQSVALHMHGETNCAIKMIVDALSLAEPGGFIRLFVDEDGLITELLKAAAKHGTMLDYINRLLTVLETEDHNRSDKPYQSSTAINQSLIEPLSHRELEVLQLIAQGLSNSEIGEQLFLALDTVKGHNRNIFSKLQVKRRTAAVARARELGLI